MVVQVLLLSEFALWSESAGRHEDCVDEEHGKGVVMFLVAEQYLDQLTLVLP